MPKGKGKGRGRPRKVVPPLENDCENNSHTDQEGGHKRKLDEISNPHHEKPTTEDKYLMNYSEDDNDDDESGSDDESNTTSKGKKIMTSAIKDMGIAETRRNLAKSRKKWKMMDPINLFYPSDELEPGLSCEKFNLMFVIGQHEKRHNKGKQKKFDDDDDEDYDDEDEDEYE